MISNLVQPIRPFTNLNIDLVNQYCKTPPDNVTTAALVTTVPSLPVSDTNFTPTIPGHILSALVSQQAVNNLNMSTTEKNSNGVLPGAVGITLKQINKSGGIIKPGSEKFVQDLKNKFPEIKTETLLSKTMFTGNKGVKNLKSLTNNTTAQAVVVSDSIKKANNELTNKGILKGKESPNEISGVVLAAAAVGSSVVADILKSPTDIAGKLNSSVSKLISGGNFAANIADSVTSGMSSVAASISASISNLGSNISTSVSNIVSGTKSLAQKAFSLAENSFGSLKSGIPNILSGNASGSDNPTGAAQDGFSMQRALEQKESAEAALAQAKKLYKAEETPGNLEILRNAESKLAESMQKIQKTKNNSFNLSSTVSNIASSIKSTATSGMNAFVGGVTAFVGNVEKGISTGISTVKNLISSSATAVQNLAGNIKNNLTNAVSGAANNAKAAVAGALGAANSLSGGKLKLPASASGTFDQVKAAMASVFSTGLDPKVPPPSTEEVAFKAPTKPDVSSIKDKQAAYMEAQKKYTDHMDKIASIQQEYNETKDSNLLTTLESLHSQTNSISNAAMKAGMDYFKSLI